MNEKEIHPKKKSFPTRPRKAQSLCHFLQFFVLILTKKHCVTSFAASAFLSCVHMRIFSYIAINMRSFNLENVKWTKRDIIDSLELSRS